MGYANSFSEFLPCLGDLYKSGGLSAVVWFLAGQLKSIETQALAMGEAFNATDYRPLVLASIFQISEQRAASKSKETGTPGETLKSIWGTSLYQTFFMNARGEKEHLIIAYVPGSHKNPYKKHYPAVTTSDIRSIAYLRANVTDAKKMKIIERELEVWSIFRKLRVPHVPELYESKLARREAALFVEGFKNQDIFGTLLRISESRLAFSAYGIMIRMQLLIKAAEVIFEFLEAIHQHGYLHLDIKPENLLHIIDEKRGRVERVAVTDFGFVEKLPEESSCCDCEKGSLPYAAPEILRDRKAEKASDIWSAAITLSAIKHLKFFSPTVKWYNNQLLINGRFLYCGTQEDLEKVFIDVNYFGREELLDVVDRWILSLLKMDPKERPTAAEALRSFRTLIPGIITSSVAFCQGLSGKKE